MAESATKPLGRNEEEKPAEEMTEEQKFKAKFPGGGKPDSTNFLRKKLQKGVKYFDSGDYQMAKTSKRPMAGVGAAIPKPENIPHRKTSVPSKLASPTSVSVQD